MTLHSCTSRPMPGTSPQRATWTWTVSLTGSSGAGSSALMASASVAYWKVTTSPSRNRLGGRPVSGLSRGVPAASAGSGMRSEPG